MFYRTQQIVADEVKKYAEESIEKAQNEAQDHALLSDDGSSSIRRNSPHCTYDGIESGNHKIVAFSVANKQGFCHPEEIFDKSSNILESEAMRRALNQIKFKDKVLSSFKHGDLSVGINLLIVLLLIINIFFRLLINCYH